MPAKECVPETAAPPDFDWRWIAVPLALAAATALLDLTDLDRVVERWFFDADTTSFPLRHSFLFDTVLHHWTTYLVVLITFLTFGAWAFSHVDAALSGQRRLLLFLALALALAPAAVSALKLVSDRHCPWDIEEFGGMVPYNRLFDALPPEIKPGHCFPAGHASTGFTLMAFYFAGRASRRRDLARWGLAIGLLGGMILGVARMAQGAHFLSHTVWSGLICWSVALTVYMAILGPSVRQRAGMRA